jgi:hypothetical protein
LWLLNKSNNFLFRTRIKTYLVVSS